ncbi:MAG: LCP family protein, partial [Actinomadura sp.]
MVDGGPAGQRTPAPPGETRPEGTERDEHDPPGGRARRDAALRRLVVALLAAAVSPALPGLAHLRAGRVRLGAALLAVQAALLAGAVIAAGHGRSLILELSVSPGWLLALAVGSVVLAGLWAALIIHSYTVLVPEGLSPPLRLAGAVAVSVLCLLAVVPPVTLAHFGRLQRDLVTDTFAEERGAGAAGRPGRPSAPPDGDPWARIPRLDVLLIGGDADVGRPGIRTDSMTLASIDTRTGNTVLLSLPRNLQSVPVWSGRKRIPFPDEELLNAVYETGRRRPEVLAGGGRVRNPGAELLKRTVAHILGRPVPYYAMVDMRSFRQIVDAIGGVRICVGEAIPVPRQQVPAGVLKPGCRRLSGREALWYGRSRTGSSDYARM